MAPHSSVHGIHIGDVWVPKSSCVRNLGVWLDEGMNMQTQVKNGVQSSKCLSL